MKETIVKLVDLQRADHKRAELKKKKDDLDGGLAGAKKAVDAAKAEADAAHHALQEAKAATNRHEIDLKGREDQIRDLNAKLNTATSNKEYQGFLLKIGEHKIENGRIEERILLAMDEVDAKAKLHEVAKAKLRDAESAMRAAEDKIAAEKAQIEDEAAAVGRQRDEMAAQIPAEALRIYERIRAGNRKSGTAVAVVHGEYCQGCQMAITSQELSDLIRGERILICRTCQRILVLEA